MRGIACVGEKRRTRGAYGCHAVQPTIVTSSTVPHGGGVPRRIFFLSFFPPPASSPNRGEFFVTRASSEVGDARKRERVIAQWTT